MARLNECILYRDFEHGDLLDEMADHMGHQEDGDRCNKDRQHLLIMGHV